MHPTTLSEHRPHPAEVLVHSTVFGPIRRPAGIRDNSTVACDLDLEGGSSWDGAIGTPSAGGVFDRPSSVRSARVTGRSSGCSATAPSVTGRVGSVPPMASSGTSDTSSGRRDRVEAISMWSEPFLRRVRTLDAAALVQLQLRSSALSWGGVSSWPGGVRAAARPVPRTRSGPGA